MIMLLKETDMEKERLHVVIVIFLIEIQCCIMYQRSLFSVHYVELDCIYLDEFFTFQASS